MLDQLGKVVALITGVIAIIGAVVGVINTVERPRVQVQIRKDRNRIPPALLKQLNPPTETIADYENPQFGSITITVSNSTDTDVHGVLELGGLTKLAGVEVIDSQLEEPILSGYKNQLAGVSLVVGEPCPTRTNWPDRPDIKLELPVPILPSYGGHITLAAYGLPTEKVDACFIGASVQNRYLIRLQDSRMLHQYPVWLFVLSLLLLASAILLFLQSRKNVGKAS